jgi:hypothetical protein
MQFLFSLEKVIIILMFDIAFPVYLEPPGETGVFHGVACMYAFEKYGILIFKQIPDEIFGNPAANDIGLQAQMSHETCLPGVIIHAGTQGLKRFIRFTVILKAVKMNTDTGLGECPDFVKYINDSTIVWRPWDVERDDMEVLITGHAVSDFQ